MTGLGGGNEPEGDVIALPPSVPLALAASRTKVGS